MRTGLTAELEHSHNFRLSMGCHNRINLVTEGHVQDGYDAFVRSIIVRHNNNRDLLSSLLFRSYLFLDRTFLGRAAVEKITTIFIDCYGSGRVLGLITLFLGRLSRELQIECIRHNHRRGQHKEYQQQENDICQ